MKCLNNRGLPVEKTMFRSWPTLRQGMELPFE
jgi:hypothetical protein